VTEESPRVVEAAGDAGWGGRFERMIRSGIRLRPEDPLSADANLANLGLDSVGMVILMVEVEAEYGIALPEELLGFDTFATPAALWAVIQRLRQATAPD
jgi:acyl carrier protein